MSALCAHSSYQLLTGPQDSLNLDLSVVTVARNRAAELASHFWSLHPSSKGVRGVGWGSRVWIAILTRGNGARVHTCYRDMSWDEVSCDHVTQDIEKNVFIGGQWPALWDAQEQVRVGTQWPARICAGVHGGAVLQPRERCVAAESPPRIFRVGSSSFHTPLELPELRGLARPIHCLTRNSLAMHTRTTAHLWL